MHCPDFDFETYSEAGYCWVPRAGRSGLGKWDALPGASKKSIFAVGGAAYAEHPTTEIISVAYNLKRGEGPKLWTPEMPPPVDLLTHVANGGLLEAHNCLFEYEIWNNVGVRLFGWPRIEVRQLRDSMEKARAFCLPGKLEKGCEALELDVKKNPDGKRLIRKFSNPRDPTKTDPRLRILPSQDLEDAAKFYSYNLDDIAAESALSKACPELINTELEFALCTREMNARGVQIDLKAVNDCISVLEQAYEKYDAELALLTGGAVQAGTETQKLADWLLENHAVETESLDEEHITKMLESPMVQGAPRRALEIRQLVASAGVKKVYAMRNQTTRSGRLKQLFIFHGARTGRDTGADVQPQNLTKNGPRVAHCEEPSCNKYYGPHLEHCPFCGTPETFSSKSDWYHGATDSLLEVLATKELGTVERTYHNAILAVSGCIRGMFIAAPGKDLICSDYSSIEAVVAACISGEQWRIDAFNRGDDIYLTSAGQITGKPLDWYMQNGGKKHPDRQNIGKPAELGLGFGGWTGAWYSFGGGGTEDEAKELVLAWRNASPNIVSMWKGLEDAAMAAVTNPGRCYKYGPISYGVKDDILFALLPSGRRITYHQPRIEQVERWGRIKPQLSFKGNNTNPKTYYRDKPAGMGFVRMFTYGGKLFENVVQAIARDIMAHGVINLERAGYPIVLRVHDEVVAEVDKGFGSIEELERIMATLPDWAAGWPIKAAGGWRGHRYRKD